MSEDQWRPGRQEPAPPAAADAGSVLASADPPLASVDLVSSGDTVPPGDTVPSAGPTPAEADHSADEETARLVRAVDAVELAIAQPVHTHATSYQRVHALLQDALSATDRPAP